jgi:hypothetical protein
MLSKFWSGNLCGREELGNVGTDLRLIRIYGQPSQHSACHLLSRWFLARFITRP